MCRHVRDHPRRVTARVRGRNHPSRGPRTTDRSVELGPGIDSRTAKRIILFIGDGMGDSEITLARNYAVGAAGRLAMDTLLPLSGSLMSFNRLLVPSFPHAILLARSINRTSTTAFVLVPLGLLEIVLTATFATWRWVA